MTKVLAHIVSWIIVAAMVWLILSALISFAALDWRAITDSVGGRFVFAGGTLWLLVGFYTRKEDK